MGNSISEAEEKVRLTAVESALRFPITHLTGKVQGSNMTCILSLMPDTGFLGQE